MNRHVISKVLFGIFRSSVIRRPTCLKKKETGGGSVFGAAGANLTPFNCIISTTFIDQDFDLYLTGHHGYNKSGGHFVRVWGDTSNAFSVDC